jgi:metallo-beta-lactamase class B
MNRTRSTIVWAAAAFLSASPALAIPVTQAPGEAPEAVRIIGNIHYVGAQYGSYLITTPSGHILLDTGDAAMHEVVVANIAKLGFDVRDIRVMISSHAHWDHVEGHAAMQRLTGAEVVALGGDAEALRSGEDNSALGARGWDPVPVHRVIQDGDSVVLGDVTLRALWTGGHTQGATMWTTTVEEAGSSYSVAFRGGEIPNAGVQLIDNPRHPSVVEDTRRTLERLNALEPPDLFLHNHARGAADDLDPDLPVSSGCVTCMDADMWVAYVARVTAAFETMLREAGIRVGPA